MKTLKMWFTDEWGNTCWQTILVKYHTLFLLKTGKDVLNFVVCCSRDWRFLKGLKETSVHMRQVPKSHVMAIHRII